MDPLSIVTSVIGVALAIKTWTETNKEKKEVMEEISGHADRVSHVLGVLKDKMISDPEEFDRLLGPPVIALGVTLNKTLEHLKVWSSGQMQTSKKIVSFFAPGTVTAIFQGHQKRIFQDMTIVLFSISTATYLQSNLPDQLKKFSKPAPLEWVRNSEVRDFWASRKFEEVFPLTGIFNIDCFDNSRTIYRGLEQLVTQGFNS